MRQIKITAFWIFISYNLIAQKEDFNWLLGDVNYDDSLYATANINFNNSPISIEYIDKNPGFNFVSSSLSDSLGNLVCFTNGTHIFNSNFEIIENGNDIQPSSDYPFGFIGTQSTVMLPIASGYVIISGAKKNFYLPSGILTSGFLPLNFTTLFFAYGENLLVKDKNSTIITDTILRTGISACRHADGKNWWVLALKHDSNQYYKILCKDDEPEIQDLQKIGDKIPSGWDHTVFSPDGKWYIRYSWWGSTSDPHSSIYLYNFDRCSGTLSNFQQHELKDNGPGGVAISPNSRYLYVSNWDTIFQYDLHAQNIFETETIVASYDGFTGEDGWPTRFFTPQLAPDNRIYLCVPNVSSRYLHYIEYPDSAGLACNVVQHGIKLPVYNSNTLPNLPYFRLGVEKGSPCDTVGKGDKDDFIQIKVQPNPGADEMILRMPGDGLPQAGELRMYSALGVLVLQMEIPMKNSAVTINTTGLAHGLYFYELKLNGKQIALGKWIKGV